MSSCCSRINHPFLFFKSIRDDALEHISSQTYVIISCFYLSLSLPLMVIKVEIFQTIHEDYYISHMLHKCCVVDYSHCS